MIFNNRQEAAELLLPELSKFQHEDCIVLAIPRGGVPIGKIIADYLGCPLDIFLSKKIGHPGNPEFAIGSVTLDSYEVEREFENDYSDYLENEIKDLQEALRSKKKLLTDNKPAIELKNKTVILVDDGIATGRTIIASIKDLRKVNTKKIVVAVPVSSIDAADEIRRLADEFICLHEPSDFSAVGQFYRSFHQVSDEEVKELLNY